LRHRVDRRKLGRVTPHRIALLRNLTAALIERERIRTTLVKAKELRRFAERLITTAKREGDSVHLRRLVRRDLHEPKLVKKLFDTIGPRFSMRPGGYTRILRLGPRPGDGTEMAQIELIGSEYQPKEKDKKKKKKKASAAEAKGQAAAES
jgi:large subunit ribosomal protein L17